MLKFQFKPQWNTVFYLVKTAFLALPAECFPLARPLLQAMDELHASDWVCHLLFCC
jgi:hypothetical protein